MVLFSGTGVPLLAIVALLSSKQLWGPYAPDWLDAMTEQRTALLGMVAGNFAIAIMIRVIARVGKLIEPIFAGIAGLCTFTAGHAHISDAGAPWQTEVLAMVISLTLVPAVPRFANGIYGLPKRLIRLCKSPGALLLLTGILVVAYILLLEWLFGEHVAWMRAVISTVIEKTLIVGKGLLAIGAHLLLAFGYCGSRAGSCPENSSKSATTLIARTERKIRTSKTTIMFFVPTIPEKRNSGPPEK